MTRKNIFGQPWNPPLQPQCMVPVRPTCSQMTLIPWVQLPGWVQAHLRSYVKMAMPGIKDFAYFWNQHLTDQGRIKVLKDAGVD